MEKLIYLISKDDLINGDQFRENLINQYYKEVENLVQTLQINVLDSLVQRASLTRVGQEAEGQLPSAPVADGMICMWIKSVSLRFEIEAVLAKFTKSFHGYLVTESEPLENTTLSFSPAKRTPGFDQVAFLMKPSYQDYDDWLYNWQSLHTQVAIDTQSTCRYIQNVVVRVLNKGSPVYHAIVEEGYPDETAMYDPMVFYDAEGDQDKMTKNIELMMESCSRFIDFEHNPTDLIAMSQYIIKK